MHDAGEKDTPPSDRLVVARKPLLPAPYARFYSSTRFRSVSRFRARLLSSPSKLFELSAILVAPPLPAARSRPYRSSPIETCSKTRAHYSSILESSSANLCFDPSSSSRLGRSVDYDYIRRRDFTRYFSLFFQGFWLIWDMRLLSNDTVQWTKSVCFSKDSPLDFERIAGTKI